MAKLRAFSEDFSGDEAADELFEDSEPLDAFEYFNKVGRTYTPAEKRFLADYKKYKSLNTISGANVNMAPSAQVELEELDDSKLAYRDLDVLKLRDDFETQVKTVLLMSDTSTDSSHPDSVLGDAKQNVGQMLWAYRRTKWLTLNASEEDIAAKLEERYAKLSLKHVPKESYAVIYSNFVDKSKPLKADKRINLEDLVEVINAGWISEDKWERAAKGLA